MSTTSEVIDRLRQPEYTGENRCGPCTVVNALIALLAAGAVALAWVPAGAVVLLAGAGAIYLRGYLVPGTPELTRRYLPERVLRAFGKESTVVRRRSSAGASEDAEATDPTGTGGEVESSDVEAMLRSNSVVDDDPDTDDLRLTAEFRGAWWRRIRRFREDDEAAKRRLAAVLDLDPELLGFENDDRFVVTLDGDRISRWDSDAAFYADLAVEPTLREWLPDWEGLGDRRRTELIAGMRAFLESCPACETTLTQVENVRKSCCSSDVVGVDVDCETCGARVFSGTYR